MGPLENLFGYCSLVSLCLDSGSLKLTGRRKLPCDCRSREFLWQEGHTAFATKEEADKEVLI